MQHANNQARLLYILKYLWENTDDEHMATLAQIVDHLSGVGIQAVSKTVAADIELLRLAVDFVALVVDGFLRVIEEVFDFVEHDFYPFVFEKMILFFCCAEKEKRIRLR